MKHYSVLLKESIENLNIKEDGIYVDATLGYAGHSKIILQKLKKGFLFAFDQDQKAILESEKTLNQIGGNFLIIHSNFNNIEKELNKNKVSKVDGILFDLGFSSPQIDDPKRGFSFMNDGPLDMRMNEQNDFSAKELINNYEFEKLVHIFFSYGEEKLSKVIAKKIITYRENKSIEKTKELVEIIATSVGAKYFNEHHPERKIFQAIRIEVNQELKVLETILPQCIKILNTGGRICVITFHSLEDRIVKQIFQKYSQVDEIVKGLPNIPEEYKPLIKIINKKPILPSVDEINQNSRSKSAKLRVVERI